MNESFGTDAPSQLGSSPERATTNGKAIASLVLGIIGLTGIPFVASVVALVLGYSARTEIHSRGQKGNELATAGIILGWVGVALAVVGLLFVAIFFISIPGLG